MLISTNKQHMLNHFLPSTNLTRLSLFGINAKRILFLFGIILGLVCPVLAQAAPILTVEPVTWNIIGLDSNNVTTGPNQFPVGARVCNTGDETANNVEATFVWDSGNSYINLRPGTASSLPPSGSDPINLAAGDCIDAYFEAEVTRDASAYDATRGYHIEITADNAPDVSTPTPRELYVKKLVSQARNSTIDMGLSTDGSTFNSIAPGGTMSLIVGNTYWIQLVAKTATNGYEQIESFINFPNIIFQLISVATTYTAPTGGTGDTPYGDACTWESDPSSPNYLSCLSTGKAGGDITVTFEVKILSMPDAPLTNPEPLSMMIYDFSGASVHYNSDYSASTRFGGIVDPSAITISKNFSPDPIGVNGVSALTFIISNPSGAVINDANFIDTFPTSPGTMTLANTTTSNTCGGTLSDSSDGSLSAGDVGIKLINGVIPANASCSITVNVTADTASPTPYSNTTDNLHIGTIDTGNNASDTLTVTNAPTPPAPTCGIELATWDFSSSLTPTFQSSLVSSATATYYLSGTPANDLVSSVSGGFWSVTSNGGASGIKWPETASGGYPNNGTAPYIQFQVDSSQFSSVEIQFDVKIDGNWANAANNHIYVWSNSNGGGYDSTARLDFSNITSTQWYTERLATASTTGSTTTGFRINEIGAKGTGTMPHIDLDNVRILGCRILNPPTITKSFSPDPVAVGGTSTLTLTLTNPNPEPSSSLITGVSVNDYLPLQDLQGTVSVTNGNPTVTGTGTAFLTQLAAGNIVTIPSTPQNLTDSVSVTNGSPIVTGSGTAFSTALATGSIIIINSVQYTVANILSNTSLLLTRNYGGATASGLTASIYNNYTVLSIGSDTSLTLTANYAGTTTSGITMAAGLTLTAAPTSTCRGTVTGASGKYGISLSGDRLQGTIAVTSGSASVTGTNTAFTTQLSASSRISINGVYYKVNTITNDSAMTLTTTYAGSTASGLAYSYYSTALSGTVCATDNSTSVTGTGTAFTTQLKANDVIYISSVRYTVSSVTSDTALTLTSKYIGPINNSTTCGHIINSNGILEGTVATTSGSATVTGTGTRFRTELRPGQVIHINNGATSTPYTVSSIASDTSLTLTTNVTTGATGLKVELQGLIGLAGGGSATCTITASVKANAAGVHTNVSGVVSASQSGENQTSTGYATDTLTAVLPPVISKAFMPNTISSGGTSTLTFTITNPNQNNALSGVKFTDTFPSGVTVASTPNITNTCGGTLYRSDGTTTPIVAGDTSIRLGSSTETDTGTVSAGGSCTITVNVTASTVTGNLTGTVSVTNNSTAVTGSGGTLFSTELAAGRTIYIAGVGYRIASITNNTSLTLTTPYAGPDASGLTVPSGYFNISGNVAHIINGSPVNGNTASDTLMVRNAIPGISLLKQVGSSATGPWFDTLAINTTDTPDVYYQFTVENNGDVALGTVSVTDPTVSTAGCSWPAPLPVAVAANDNHLATCVVGSVTAVSGSHTNTARSTGTCGVTGCPATSPDDTATYKTVGLTIDKSVLEDSFVEAGDILNYSFLVTNSGFASLFGPVTVDDDKVSVACPAVSTVGDNDNYFDPGESIICGTQLSGTVAVTNSNATVTGTGTSFSTQLIAGDIVYINSVGYTVLSITDNTNLTLFTNYTGTDATGLAIFTTAPYTVTGPDNVAELVTNIADASTTPTPNADIPGVTSDIDSVTVLKKPTLVVLSSFRAYEENGQVVVQWETSSEHNTIGFLLLRLDETTDEYKSVHKRRLPGVMRPPQGGIYSLIDRGALPGGSYTYKLVEIERSGQELTYGPFTVVVGADNLSANALEEEPSDPVISPSLRLNEKSQKRSAAIKSDRDKGTTVAISSIAQHSVLSNASDYRRQMREPSARDQVRVKARQIKSKAKIAGKKPKPEPAQGSRMKLSLSESGMYYVAAADIANALGVRLDKMPSLITRGQLSLSTQGEQVAYLPAANNAGIYFYATAIDSIYTQENAYWIEQGKGTLMDSEKAKKGKAPSSAGSGTFIDSIHSEKDTFMDTYAVPDPDADYWFWADLYSPTSPYCPDVREFTVHLDGVADTGTASISANLYGANPVKYTPHNHARVFVNDCPAGEGTWSGMQPYTITDEFSQSCLVEGDNVITVQNVLDSGVDESYIYVDSFDLTYVRNYEAANNRLLFWGDGNTAVTVSGFTSPDIMVFDITNTLLPKLQKNVALNTTSGTVRLVPEAAATQYYAVSGGGIKTADSESVPAASLVLSSNAADYIIIAPEEFVSTAQGLADYRKTQGLQAKVVRLEDVMNEFSYGISSPEAIRNFISYAWSNWSKAPRFVVLAGDASIDYKNNMGFDTNIIPTKIVSTPYGPYASDTYLADVNGNHEVAIGRLPALTAAELQTLIDKIRKYEDNTAGNLVVLLADNPDDGGDFDTDSTIIGSLLGSKYVAQQIYLGPLSRSAVRTNLFNAINSIAGVPYLNYIGHGGLINFASENLMTLGDLYPPPPSLSLFTNFLKLPVLTAMTCLSGNFEGAGYTTLSEGLVLKPNGGMAAVWSPTGFSDNALAAVLDRAFYQTIEAGTKQTLGEAVNEALRAYEMTGYHPFMMDIYNILGDPALRLKLR